MSNVTVEQLDQARALIGVAGVQNRYSLTDRGHDPVLERCAEHSIAFLAWRPVPAGPAGSALVRAVAGELGATPAQVSLAWLLHRSPALLPIPDTTRRDHLQDNVAAGDLELSDQQAARLTAASAA